MPLNIHHLPSSGQRPGSLPPPPCMPLLLTPWGMEDQISCLLLSHSVIKIFLLKWYYTVISHTHFSRKICIKLKIFSFTCHLKSPLAVRQLSDQDKFSLTSSVAEAWPCSRHIVSVFPWVPKNLLSPSAFYSASTGFDQFEKVFLLVPLSCYKLQVSFSLLLDHQSSLPVS